MPQAVSVACQASQSRAAWHPPGAERENPRRRDGGRCAVHGSCLPLSRAAGSDAASGGAGGGGPAAKDRAPALERARPAP